MVRVGLTGGLACGKSTVGKLMAERGAQVIQADHIAHMLMRPGKPVYDEVVRHFGPSIVQSDGSIDRKQLAALAFGTGRTAELNRIVHPPVIQAQEVWMDDLKERDASSIAVVEAALILEAGTQGRFDKLVVVTCSPEQRVERFAARHGLGREEAAAEVERRMAAQKSDEEKVRAADYVIDNSGTIADLEKKVDALMKELRALARKD